MIRIVFTARFYKKHFRVLIHDSYILEYVWIDGYGNLRSKYRTAYPCFDSMGDAVCAHNWNYDDGGGGAFSEEIVLVPVAHFSNPFFEPGRAFFILCDTYRADGIPTDTNFRCHALTAFSKGLDPDLRPWFRIKQDCAVGVGVGVGTLRKLAEKHYEYCLQAGLQIGGINADVAPNRWEFRIGPCCGLDAGDELWVARYILHKLGQEFGVCISFKPEVVSTKLNTTFSTEETREKIKGGLKRIYKYIDRLSKKNIHNDPEFALGAATTEIRIPTSVLKAGCGYFEDRRPPSDDDPYRVIAAIFITACFD